MRRVRIAIGCLLLICMSIAAAQQKKAMTNQDVITMVKSGFEERIILLAIQANPADFDLSVPAMLSLKSANVSDAVLRAMISKAGTKKATTAPAAPPAPPAKTAATTWRGPAVFRAFPRDFSAEWFATVEGKPEVSDGKVFVGNGRLRLESAGANSKVTIVDPLTPVAWVQSAGKPAEVQTVFQSVRGFPSMTAGISMFLLPTDPQDPCLNWMTVECTAMGMEMIDGRATTKWDLTHHLDTEVWHSTIWIDARLHVVSKKQYEQNVFQMRNIVEAPQPASLFEAQ